MVDASDAFTYSLPYLEQLPVIRAASKLIHERFDLSDLAGITSALRWLCAYLGYWLRFAVKGEIVHCPSGEYPGAVCMFTLECKSLHIAIVPA